MNWVPVVFIIFKVGVLGIGMFYSIKWHYDQGKSAGPIAIRRVVLEGAMYAAAVMILFAAMFALFHHFRMLPVGMDF